MPNREHLQKEILVLTEIIKDNRVAVRSRTMPPETRELLRQAIVQREKKLIALQGRLASLRHS
jgi:hypothetical protein